jgi:hypothetical protein
MQKEKLKKMDALSSDSIEWEERKKTSAQELRVLRWDPCGGPIHVSRKVHQSGLEKKSVVKSLFAAKSLSGSFKSLILLA